MNISKHLFFGLSLLALTTFACKSSKPAVTDTTTPKRPNIVFIMADDHAVSSISAYEDWLADIAPTPNIDRIANEGMLMTRTFNTNSICGPMKSMGLLHRSILYNASTSLVGRDTKKVFGLVFQ